MAESLFNSFKPVKFGTYSIHSASLAVTRLLSATLVLVATAFASAESLSADHPFSVAGYLPDYRFDRADAILSNASRYGLTDLIVSSAELKGDGTLEVSRLKACPWQKLANWKLQNSARLWLSLGGWERSANFAQVIRSPEKLQRFIDSLLEFAQQKKLDGIDLDWEHPKDREEEALYAHLLSRLRKAFAPRKLRVSLTLAAWQRLPPKAFAAADRIQVMAYDHPGRHSTLEHARTDVKTLIDKGLPRQKILLGLPFYGRDVNSRAAMTYEDISRQFKPKPNTDSAGTIYFNGPSTIRAKTNLALRGGLGGVMIWELGQDTLGDASLLKVIHDAVPSAAN